MSYYYSYYVGYRTPDDKIYPLGPYNSLGKLNAVIEVSRSSASDLHNDLIYIAATQITDELRKEFQYRDWNGDPQIPPLKWLPVDDLPKGDFIQKDYFLIEDVRTYEEADDNWDVTFDLFYNRLTPTVYAQMAANEVRFGKPKPKLDCEGNPMEVHSASDYMYYAYPDYNSREYEAFMLRHAADVLHPFKGLPEGSELVIIETEG